MNKGGNISARRGDVDCMWAFIRAKFDINSRGQKGYTILNAAILSGLKMVTYILQLEGGERLVNAMSAVLPH